MIAKTEVETFAIEQINRLDTIIEGMAWDIQQMTEKLERAKARREKMSAELLLFRLGQKVLEN